MSPQQGGGSSSHDHEQRIYDLAHELWRQDGSPEGRDQDYLEKARELVAIEENPGAGTLPNPARSREARSGSPEAEPVEAVENQGEFPTMRDQGDEGNRPIPRRHRS